MQNLFNKLIDKNELSHAYYFEGGKGLEFSLWLATRILCCGNGCLNCTSILNLESPDVIIVSPDTTSIKVDQIRNLHERAAYKSFSGKGQVFIIDKADSLNLQASNALLKFLEDPKPQTYILLVGNDHHKLIETIKSRVQTIPLPINQDFMKEAVKRGLNYKALPIIEDLDYSVDDAEALAEYADNWVESIKYVLSSDRLTALQKVQEWTNLFANKEDKVICIKLIQSYVRALLHEKQGKFHNWGSLPVYDYTKLLKFSDSVDELSKAIQSNGQFLLHIESFIKKAL